jgi:ribonuclease G
MKGDRAKYNIQPPSRFGVIEMTRQRVRPETDIKTTEVCSTCGGSGEVQASILVIEEIEHKLIFLLERDHKSISLNVHPFIAAYLRKGVKSIQRKWLIKHKKWIQIQGLTKLGMLDYNFIDSNNKEIKI